MADKRISAGNILIMFNSTCPKCEHQQDELEDFSVTVYDLLEVGNPVCCECGEDMTATGECEIIK